MLLCHLLHSSQWEHGLSQTLALLWGKVPVLLQRVCRVCLITMRGLLFSKGKWKRSGERGGGEEVEEKRSH